MSDGLTVPFALAAGLSGAVESTSIVITAGLAEIAAGSIAMGLGGYLAARSDAEHYDSERRREQAEVRDIPAAETKEVTDMLASYGVSAEAAAPVVRALQEQPEAWVDFMMRFELGLEQPDPKRALVSAATIAGAYIAGGLIPLAPYFVFAAATRALVFSVVVTLLALGVFGYVKGHFTGAAPFGAPCRRYSLEASPRPRPSGLPAPSPERTVRHLSLRTRYRSTTEPMVAITMRPIRPYAPMTRIPMR
jgi:vacuolar iron transporter family protein